MNQRNVSTAASARTAGSEGARALSRHAFLGLAGLTAAGVLAGCSSTGASAPAPAVVSTADPASPGNVSSFDLAGGTNGRAPTIKLNSGYEMPVAGIGVLQLGAQECYESVTAALDAGVRLVDTAYAYRNEAQVGQAIRDSPVPREEVFVTTKLFPTQFATAGTAIDGALERMGLDYIDLMLLHHPGSFDIDAYHAMERAVASGKVCSIGLSNWYNDEIDQLIEEVSIVPALVQNEIHPLYSEPQVIPHMHDLGIAVEAWYPLGGRGHVDQMLADQTVVGVAQELGRTPAQTILRWHLQRGVVAIPGSGNPDHIVENISLFDFELSETQMEAIDNLNRDEKLGSW
ncbi:aldo/keto reductase [Actinomyces sp. MRS3W]|uniref:aldo/keto reductase n=1 Tax=Actinomyces sp. MRS3W TaxID=2800796 RepID=UPI0028FD0B32|nr:aldo/keto reductase [Actinomyces sp. MRS3W]MDU0349565.1 aldo/keto reductase [Actinomyces sp. MRS3W]